MPLLWSFQAVNESVAIQETEKKTQRPASLRDKVNGRNWICRSKEGAVSDKSIRTKSNVNNSTNTYTPRAGGFRRTDDVGGKGLDAL